MWSTCSLTHAMAARAAVCIKIAEHVMAIYCIMHSRAAKLIASTGNCHTLHQQGKQACMILCADLRLLLLCSTDFLVLCIADSIGSWTASAAPHEAPHCRPNWSHCISHELLHVVPQVATTCSFSTKELCRCSCLKHAAKDGAEESLNTWLVA